MKKDLIDEEICDPQLNIGEICLKEKELSLLSDTPIWVRKFEWKIYGDIAYKNTFGGNFVALKY